MTNQNLSPQTQSSASGSFVSGLSLRVKLIIMVVGVATLLVIALASYNYINTRTQITQSVSNNLRNVAQVQSAAIGDLLTRQINLLQSLATDKTLQDVVLACDANHCGDPQTQTNLAALEAEWQNAYATKSDSDPLVQSVLNNPAAVDLYTFRANFPDNLEILATSQYGALVAATQRTSSYSYADEVWWRLAYNNGRGDIYISQPEMVDSLNQNVILIAVPIYYTSSHQVIGILRGAVPVTPMASLLASSPIGQTGEVDLLFRGGQALTPKGALQSWPSSAIIGLGTSRMSDVMQLQLQNNMPVHMVTQAEVDSSDPIVGSTIYTLHWRTIASIEPAEALAPVNTAIAFNLLISIGILAIAILLILSLAQYLTGPITRLTRVAEQVLAGNTSVQATVESQDEIGLLAQTFNHMTARLSHQIDTLEQNVKERTHDLERQAQRLRAAAEVARDAASARDPQEFLDRAALLIYKRFGFYHTGIFLIDQDQQYAVLRASPTPAGQEMLKRNHRLRVGEQGIVGYVSASREPRIALDTGVDAVYFDNPLLPDTHSEMALPLKTNQRIVGVLDIQSDQPNAFTQDDIFALQGMADQLTTALERISLLQQVETSLSELEKSYSEFTEQTWRRFAMEQPVVPGYRYDSIRIEPISEISKEARESLAKGATVTINRGEDPSGFSTAAIPIRMRGQTLGVIHVRFQADTPPETTVALIEQISDRLAAALENTRLIEETRKRAQRDAMVSELGGRVRSTLDLESVLKTAAQEFQRAFQLKEAEIWLGPTGQNGGKEKKEVHPGNNGKRSE